jgi:hypothetical protein
MSARDFSKVSPLIWRSSRFRGLSDAGKIGFFYLISNAHVTSAGVYELPDGYACADLGWSPERYADVCSELEAAEMIDRDPVRDIVLIERWFKHNPPMSADHATGCRRRLDAIESERLREKALAAFDVANDERVAREAAKEAERAARQARRAVNTNALVGETARLLNSGYMRK